MLEGNSITIQGFEIPSDHPIFLTIIAIHVLAGLTCVISGIFAMLSQKRPGLHPKSGTIYYWSLWIVFITACIVAFIRWKEDYHLFLLGVVSFTAAFVARRAYRRKWPKWTIYHITGMGISYIFLLIAFYVDNGRFLPVWKSLNPVIYWLLPLIIGIPIIIRTLYRHPLSKEYFTKK
jgi:hypothetical protein